MSNLTHKFPIYIPAGSQPSENEDPLLVKAGVTNKALIEVNGKQLIDYVLEEVDQSKYVDRIYVVGISAEDIEYHPKLPIEFIPSVGSRMDTLMNMINYLDSHYEVMPEQLLVLSADVPLIKASIIDNILENLKSEYGDKFEKINYYYPIVPKDKVFEKYPEANKRYRKFTEGIFATGDFHVLSPKVLKNEKTVTTVTKIMNSRKTIVRLLFKFDLFAPFKYMLGKLSIRKQVIPFLTKELDLTIELMITDFPEIVIDLDYPDDLELMSEFLER